MAKERKTIKTSAQKPIEQYEHKDKHRLNNPPVGLVDAHTDNGGLKKKTYQYDPHLDPQLVWAGKAEHTSFEVPTVSLHVHERIDPRRIIETVRKGEEPSQQMSLFETNKKPLREAIEFYKHKENWTNRLIAGDSLLVMNSLLEKEGMGGKVQMIYFDPPYGIKYGSNFQPFVNKRDVKDGKDEDLTAEPEMIKAFRDTWELGIHSYLQFIKDRMHLAKDLLHDSGSVFIQISDQNAHYIRNILDEVFGPQNFVVDIIFTKTGSKESGTVDPINDHLIWYVKDKSNVKYRRLFQKRKLKDLIDDNFKYLDKYGNVISEIPENYDAQKVIRFDPITSDGFRDTTTVEVEFDGKKYFPGQKSHWKVSVDGLKQLDKIGRLVKKEKSLQYLRKLSDFPVKAFTNIWDDLGGASNMVYVVQTNPKVIERCMLMSTDPGDLVLDITCGSGTTAYVAENWGRCWITCDTSRVAITLAKQRLMTAVFDYYELAHPNEGVGSGFKYKTVPHVTLKSIANNPEIDGIYQKTHTEIEKALAGLNASLKGSAIRFEVTTGGRAGQIVDFAAPDSQTFTMPSGQVVQVNQLLEWEVPFECPDTWPETARKALEAFHKARRNMQEKMDEAIAKYAPQETLYDQPFVDAKKIRVTGPFTVEAVPAPVAKSFEEVAADTQMEADRSIARSGETLRQEEWRNELLRTGVRAKGGKRIEFTRVEPLSGTRFLQAEGEVMVSEKLADDTKATPLTTHNLQLTTKKVVVCFGPEHAPLEQRMVELALEEARTLKPKPEIILFCAFHFDPEARKDIEETNWPGMTLLEAQMNADLLTDDLKKKRSSNESFWLIGQPDVQITEIKSGEDKGKYIVEVNGFDYYNPKTGTVESGGKNDIAMWMLDHDYDGRSLFPSQVFFPMAGAKEGWATLVKNLKAEIDEEKMEAFRGTVSLPFKPGKNVAVKIVDARGIESLKIIRL